MKIEGQNRERKPEKKIIAADLNLKIGKPAKITLEDGQLCQTSPVKCYNVAGGHIYIETENTIYRG